MMSEPFWWPMMEPPLPLEGGNLFNLIGIVRKEDLQSWEPWELEDE